MVSQQAGRLVTGSPAVADAHFVAESRPYHPTLRPDGYLNLGSAENRLVWDLLAERVARRRPIKDTDTRYAPLYGTLALRERIAAVLTPVCGYPVDPQDLVVVGGATAALDVIATALCDPGEAIVVPAPYYSGFDVNLAGRSGARLLPAPALASDGFRLPVSTVERVLTDARRNGVTVRAVALSTPSNPAGQVYPAKELRELAQVAADHDVDVIADEVYAHSVFGPEPFTSMLTPTVNAASAACTHMVWGFAKDFGLPGFKVGVLHTTHPEVRAAARALAYFAPTSTDTQALLTELLSEPEWVSRFLDEGRGRLAGSYERVTGLLGKFGIPYLPSQAGCSLWVDLSAWLPTTDFAGEQALCRTILDTARVSIVPGEAFHSPEPGWFRVCHTLEPALVHEAITRLGELLSSMG